MHKHSHINLLFYNNHNVGITNINLKLFKEQLYKKHKIMHICMKCICHQTFVIKQKYDQNNIGSCIYEDTVISLIKNKYLVCKYVQYNIVNTIRILISNF